MLEIAPPFGPGTVGDGGAASSYVAVSQKVVENTLVGAAPLCR